MRWRLLIELCQGRGLGRYMAGFLGHLSLAIHFLKCLTTANAPATLTS